MKPQNPPKDELSQANETRLNLADQLLLLPSVLSFVAALAIVMAASHDVGYFWYLNIDFLSLLTTSDLIKSVASWLPVVAIVGLPSFLISIAFGSSTPFISIYVTEPSLSKSAFAKIIYTIRSNIPYVIFSILVCYLMIFSVSYQYGLTFFIFTLLAIASARYLNKLMVSESVLVQSRYSLSSFALIFLFMVGFFLGWADGASDLNKNDPAYKIKGDGVEFPLIVLLRTGEKGVIYRQGENVGFMPWDNIKGISRITERPRSASLFSVIYHWLVDPPPPTP